MIIPESLVCYLGPENFSFCEDASPGFIEGGKEYKDAPRKFRDDTVFALIRASLKAPQKLDKKSSFWGYHKKY